MGYDFYNTAQFEAVDTFGDSDFVPIFDRQFLGGSYTLRGYEYREVVRENLKGEIRSVATPMRLHPSNSQRHYGIIYEVQYSMIGDL